MNDDGILKGVVKGYVLGGVDAGGEDNALEGKLDEERVGDIERETKSSGDKC